VDVTVLLSPGVTAFEALGTYGVFRRTPGATVRLVATEPGRVGAHGARVALVAECAYRDVAVTDVLVVPGGLGVRRLVDDRAVISWLAEMHEASQWTIGVSTGSVLLSAAGILVGQEATTHWLATDLLEDSGALAVPERMVRSGRIVTATGSVSGLEAALFVDGRMRGRETVDRIRGELADDLTTAVGGKGPVSADVLEQLSAVEVGDAGVPYVLSTGRDRERGSRRRVSRFARDRGRIEVVDRSPR
jgi:putative intracellular protease/amidase